MTSIYNFELASHISHCSLIHSLHLIDHCLGSKRNLTSMASLSFNGGLVQVLIVVAFVFLPLLVDGRVRRYNFNVSTSSFLSNL